MASSSSNDSSNNGNASSSSNSHELPQSSDPELAQVFAELVRGEKTAQALETHLTSLEKKIDDLLASVEQSPARHGVEKAGQGVLDGPEKS